MNVTIPAKTFLIGEYAALQGLPAIVITTQPCFRLSVTAEAGLHGIHPDSPAGRFWLSQALSQGLCFSDPYQGRGGMGASSAQFLGAYQLYSQLTGQATTYAGLLASYELAAWDRVGHRPSGYDVIAQSLSGCAVIDRQQSQYTSLAWPFDALTFVLLSTQRKCETHTHLKTLPTTLPALTSLGSLSEQAIEAFHIKHAPTLIEAVQHYHEALQAYGWISEHALAQCEVIRSYPGVRAVKGCGAMGADVLLVLLDTSALRAFQTRALEAGYKCVATESTLYAAPLRAYA